MRAASPAPAAPVLLAPPSPSALAYLRRFERWQRIGTVGYLAVLTAAWIGAAAVAARQWAAGAHDTAGLIAALGAMAALFCGHLVVGVPGLLGSLHRAGDIACIELVHRRTSQEYDYLAAAFAPEGRLRVEGVARADAAEYMTLAHRAGDAERYLAALKTRMADLRELEAPPAQIHPAGCPCVECDD